MGKELNIKLHEGVFLSPGGPEGIGMTETVDKKRLLNDAIALAAEAHKSWSDAQGDPYIRHPLRVMERVAASGLSYDAQIAAVLHDTVEDTAVSVADILEQFGEDVAKMVDALSRRPETEIWVSPDHTHIAPEETYPDFITRVIAAGRETMMIKLADIEDNMGRLGGINDAAKELRLRKKYIAARLRIMVALTGDISA